MEKIKIEVEGRNILGKKVKKLRKEGLIPANLFGKGIKSKNIQVKEGEFYKVFRKAGETGLIETHLKGEVYPAMIQNVQFDPVSGRILHADFHKVDLKEKTAAHVPIRLVGEAPAEKSGIGLVLQTLNELEIEALPTDIPHEIKLDVSSLREVGQTVQVKDLKVDREKIEVKDDPEEVVVSVQTAEMKEEVVEEAPAPEEVEAIAEKGEEEEVGEGVEKPAAAEEKKEETKEEPPE